MSLTPHQSFWPAIRAVQPSLPGKPLNGPQVSSTHRPVGPLPVPLKLWQLLPGKHGQPLGYQCQHDPIGDVGAGGREGSEGGGGGGVNGGDSSGTAGGADGGAAGGVPGGVPGGVSGGSSGWMAGAVGCSA